MSVNRIFDRLSAAVLLPILSACTGGLPIDQLAGLSASNSETPTTTRCITPSDADVLADQLLQYINYERSQRSLNPLVTDSQGLLNSVAGEFACEMVTEQFFGHEHPKTKTTPAKRILATGYSASIVGENLAAGQLSPAEVVAQWMQSDGHRENLLGPEWREAGIAVRNGGEHGVYWVLELADGNAALCPENKPAGAVETPTPPVHGKAP